MIAGQMELVEIARELRQAVAELEFAPPVRYVYRPLDYAWAAHRSYLERYGAPPKEILLVGMNPGPWGMAQTGVPFGEVNAVRDWLNLHAEISRPRDEHPRRPVAGLACPRSEISGRRLWGWARAAFGDPDRFFARFFVHNYCPLLFLEESGRNRTPDRLPAGERRPLETACDRALIRTAAALEVQIVIGIGGFAAARARAALTDPALAVGEILHPSPANPAANRGWERRATAQLAALGVVVP
jgi:single-strand selective monofunctional uracil DNA glycosylase